MSMTRLPLLLLLLALLGSCAIVSRPSGGDKDVTPPQLDSLRSTANFQTNFFPEEVLLEFDEYIQLKNATRDIILTPTPKSGKPTYEQRGRRVNIDFSEVELRDSTTYQLQFGEAIQDFNEGNPVKNLRFVFSTGSFLDSLSIRGTVTDNLTGTPSKNALVGLYRSLSDTILAKASPDYFTRSDSSGRYEISYLSPGAYQLVAYLDDNSNYRYNQGIEDIGFLDSAVTVSDTGIDSSYALVLSGELPPLKSLRGDQWFPGLVRITLNQEATDSILVREVPGTILTRYQEADSLNIAYAPPIDTLPYVLISRAGEVDTVRLRKAERAVAPGITLAPKTTVVPGESYVQLASNLPLKSFEEDLILVQVDSVDYPKGMWSISTEDARKLEWQSPTDTVQRLEITFLPGALTNVFDSLNQDSLFVTMRPAKKADYGEIELTVAGLDSLTSYILELLDARNEVDRTILLPAGAEGRENTEVVLQLSRVKGGEYTVRFTEDLNNDGRYTPGNRRLQLQPERITVLPLNTVRADWLVEERLNLNF